MPGRSDLGADDRPNDALAGLQIEVDRPVEPVAVGEGHSGKAVPLGNVEQIFHPAGAEAEGILAVDVQVHEHGRTRLSRSGPRVDVQYMLGYPI
jgi:hypothetical protein